MLVHIIHSFICAFRNIDCVYLAKSPHHSSSIIAAPCTAYTVYRKHFVAVVVSSLGANAAICLISLQGAHLMSKFGINVPPGLPAFTLDDVAKAAEEMKDENKEVTSMRVSSRVGYRKKKFPILAVHICRAPQHM